MSEPTNISLVHGDKAADFEVTATPLLAQKATKVIKGWPTAPKTIRASLFAVIANAAFDILLFACSVTFLVFALIVNYYDQCPTKDYPRVTGMLLSATKYGPTVFPILFASVVGRAAHAILCWRLTKGDRIGVLDTLATSTSLTSTVTSQVQLRMVSFLGLALIAVWALSPIGGQASIRQMTIGPQITTQPASFKYMVHNGNTMAFVGSHSGRLSAIVDSLFVSALVASGVINNSPLDPWGNVKIPKIEQYEQISTPDDEDWYDTGDMNMSTYSSFIGIPVAGINDSTFVDYRMHIHTPYLNLQCSIVNDSSVFSNDHVNFTGSGARIWYQRSDLKSRENAPPHMLTPFNVWYDPYHSHPDMLQCNVTTTYVETEISCPTASTCAATRIRRSPLKHFPAAWTQLDISYRFWAILLDGLIQSIRGKISEPTLLDRYMADTNLVIAPSTTAFISNISLDNYSVRFGHLLNSYWTIMNGMSALSGGISNDTAYFWDSNITFVPPRCCPDAPADAYGPFYNFTYDYVKARVWPTEGTRSYRIDIIMAHKSWVAMLSIASALLIVSSLIAPFIHSFLTTGPEVMMNISSLAIRNNPYISLPENGTFLNASERARLLKDMTVRFGDVEIANGVGSLAIATLEDMDGPRLGRVRKGRLYN